jgi:excisionase family DNA binding protein
MPDLYLDVATVARRLAVTPETVRAWIRAGLLQAIRTPTGGYRVPQTALAALLTGVAGRTPPTSR